ncbi:Long-chain-fatty-acid--AMP ligase FadD29 [Roseimaritima multifibrata]|uniref:Long-chain-fatty-acid--AMP ligase FadD29 n=1 Tax=Roseimaritima multifibrata TaxID=1930274 RepID=A0A517MJP8_9BACT|nr:aminotransferase class I/II-fold pyridoxal phosphate-dependent enzyme [Roseimaritima multifibrata]QDS95126.1 Long-chain-fatty-acid--AMP ligase FadD29 [Roseimaritima multifibrata]
MLNLQRYFENGEPPRTNFLDILEYWSAQRVDLPAFHFTDGENETATLSYKQLWEEVRGLGGYLQSQGVTRNERVLLLYPPGLDFVIGFFACHAAGAIAVPAYPPRRNRKAGRIRSIAQDASSRFALSIDSVADQLGGENRHQDLQDIQMIGTDHPSKRDLANWKRPSLNADDIAVLQYTSGSTGAPKGVMLTHQNLIANCAQITYAFEPIGTKIGVTWLPTYHDMGLVGGVLQPVFFGKSNVFMSPMTFLQHPVKWLRAITHYGAHISGGPNFAYQLCVDKVGTDELEGLDLSSWKIAFNGAEPIRASTLEAFAEKFASVGFTREAFLPCYGMAETTLIVTGGPSSSRPFYRSFDRHALDNGDAITIDAKDDKARPLVGCGAIIPGERIEIVDPETHQILPAGKIGEFWIQGPSVGKGYWQSEEATKNTFEAHTADGEGPFLRTGDLGFISEDQFFVSGRLKDMIIIRGVNRYPQDIEQTVEQASDIVQAGAVAAFAMEHEGREQLVIVAETVRTRDIDRDEHLQAIRRAVMAEHELPPEAVYLVRNSSVPKTSSGKIQRHACFDAVRNDTLRVVAKWVRWEEAQSSARKNSAPAMQAAGTNQPSLNGQTVDADIVAAVVEHVRSVAQERAGHLDIDTNIVLDLGLDSLERMQIAHSLEQLFDGRFPQEVLEQVETIGDVARAIETHMGKSALSRIRQLSALDSDEMPAEKKEITEASYNFAQFPEYQRLQQTKSQLLMTGVPNPYFSVHESVLRDTTIVDGKEMVSFAAFNYIGMSGDPQVTQAAQEALQKYGTSVSASRLVSGEKPVHRELERKIADFVGVDSSITFVSGHGTNESTIGHLLGPGDLILHDSLSHNSIVQGALLSGARRRPFQHNDFEEVDRILHESRDHYRRVMVVGEGVYSMDGDFCDLPAAVEVCKRHKALLMIDEAHSIGTMGATGRGISEHFGIDPRDVDIWMGTLSKGLGSTGGYIAGPKELIELLQYTAPAFVFACGLSGPAAAATLKAIEVLEAEPQRVARLKENSELFLSLLRNAGVATGLSGGTPVVPVITGNSLVALRLSHRMALDGVSVPPILYPAVEESAARVRFFINCLHTEKQLRETAAKVIKHADAMGLLSESPQAAS